MLLVLLTGCQVDIGVGIDAEPDGSGSVTATVQLDRDAAAVSDLRANLRVDDLRRAGWTVTGPVRTKAGGEEVKAVKRFATPAEAGRAMDELSGKEGPFRDFELQRDRSTFTTRTEFTGTVDLSAGLAGFSDDELREVFGGSDFGVDLEELERQLGDTVDRVFKVRVAARLPGFIDSNAPTEADNGVVWQPKLGEKAELSATGQKTNPANVAGALIAGVAAVALLVSLALARWRKRP